MQAILFSTQYVGAHSGVHECAALKLFSSRHAPYCNRRRGNAIGLRLTEWPYENRTPSFRDCGHFGLRRHRHGWESRARYPEQSFDEAEPHLQADWEKKTNRELAWERARLASRDAWDRMEPLEDR